MQCIRVVPIVALFVALAYAQSGTLRGIDPSDIDRSADACADFYQFANGRWRADNPIPAAMP
jgi:putative endopeptidase